MRTQVVRSKGVGWMEDDGGTGFIQVSTRTQSVNHGELHRQVETETDRRLSYMRCSMTLGQSTFDSFSRCQ